MPTRGELPHPIMSVRVAFDLVWCEVKFDIFRMISRDAPLFRYPGPVMLRWLVSSMVFVSGGTAANMFCPGFPLTVRMNGARTMFRQCIGSLSGKPRLP